MPKNNIAFGKNIVFAKLSPFFLLIAVLLWGYSYIVTKNILNVTSPILLTSVAYIYSGIAGIPVIIVRRKFFRQKGIFIESIVLGSLIYLSRLVQVFGCELTTAGKNAFVTSSYVVIVPILSWLILKSKLHLKNIILALVAFTGIGIIAFNNDFTSVNLGDLLTFVASVGFGIHIIYNGKYAEKHDPILLGIMQLEVAAVISLVLLLISRPTLSAEFYSVPIQSSLLYSGMLSTMLGFLLQSFAQKYLEPNRTSLIISLESVSGAVFSAILLGEQYGLRLLIGCFIVLSANIFAGIEIRKQNIND